MARRKQSKKLPTIFECPYFDEIASKNYSKWKIFAKNYWIVVDNWVLVKNRQMERQMDLFHYHPPGQKVIHPSRMGVVNKEMRLWGENMSCREMDKRKACGACLKRIPKILLLHRQMMKNI